MSKNSRKIARDYHHKEEALLRPESGTQDVFPSAKRKAPKTWRYDSSLSPELVWDEAEARSEGDRLIREILASKNVNQARQAAEKLKLSQHLTKTWKSNLTWGKENRMINRLLTAEPS